MPDYPNDYYGAEGTWDSDGNWQGGTLRNPYQNLPIPKDLDPSQVLPHQAPHGGGAGVLAPSQEQLQHLYDTRNTLLESITNLQYSTETADILQNLPTVITMANAVVHGDAHWDDHLADACRTWIATDASAGTDEQFRHARDQVVGAAQDLAAHTQQWIDHPNTMNQAIQGGNALAAMAQVANDAHQHLQPAQ
jgi:uncharacterized damage-inducible protein DinB